MSAPLPTAKDEDQHAIGSFIAEFAITESNSPLGAPERLAQQVRTELLPALEEVFEHRDLANGDAVVDRLDVDLGHWPADPDWPAVRARFREQLLAALAPYMRRRGADPAGVARGGHQPLETFPTQEVAAGRVGADAARTVVPLPPSTTPLPAPTTTDDQPLQGLLAIAHGADAVSILKNSRDRDPAGFDEMLRMLPDVQHRRLLAELALGRGAPQMSDRPEVVQDLLASIFTAAGHPAPTARGFAAQLTAQLLVRPGGAILLRDGLVSGRAVEQAERDQSGEPDHAAGGATPSTSTAGVARIGSNESGSSERVSAPGLRAATGAEDHPREALSKGSESGSDREGVSTPGPQTAAGREDHLRAGASARSDQSLGAERVTPPGLQSVEAAEDRLRAGAATRSQGSVDWADAAAVRAAWAADPTSVEADLHRLGGDALRRLLAVLLPNAGREFRDAVDRALEETSSERLLLIEILNAVLDGEPIDLVAAQAAVASVDDQESAASDPVRGRDGSDPAADGPLYGPLPEAAWAEVLSLLAGRGAEGGVAASVPQAISAAAQPSGPGAQAEDPDQQAVVSSRRSAASDTRFDGSEERAVQRSQPEQSRSEVGRQAGAFGDPEDDAGTVPTTDPTRAGEVPESGDPSARIGTTSAPPEGPRQEDVGRAGEDAPRKSYDETQSENAAARAATTSEAPSRDSGRATEDEPPVADFLQRDDAGDASAPPSGRSTREDGGTSSEEALNARQRAALGPTGAAESLSPPGASTDEQAGAGDDAAEQPAPDRGGFVPPTRDQSLAQGGADAADQTPRNQSTAPPEDRKPTDREGALAAEAEGTDGTSSGTSPAKISQEYAEEAGPSTQDRLTASGTVDGETGQAASQPPSGDTGARDTDTAQVHSDTDAPESIGSAKAPTGDDTPDAQSATAAVADHNVAGAIDALSEAAFGSSAQELLALIWSALPAAVQTDVIRRLPPVSQPLDRTRSEAEAGGVPARLILEMIAAVGPNSIDFDTLLRHLLRVLAPEDTDQAPLLRQLIARLRFASGGRAPVLQQKALHGLQRFFDGATPARPQPRSPSQTTDNETDRRRLTRHAGLVLFHPYLKLLFSRLDLLTPANRIDPDRLWVGRAALETLAGARVPQQLMDPVARLLLGMTDDQPPPPYAELDEEQDALIDGLLRSVIAQWSKLGQTSPAGLQDAFVRRGGQIRFDEAGAHLQVDPGPFDMLLDGLPWTLETVIALPWMTTPCHVSWRSQDG